MSSKSVLKLDLLNGLWDNGIKPPRSWSSDYDKALRERLLLLLGDLKIGDCSNTTVDRINDEVTKFQKSVLYHWKKVSYKKVQMQARPFLMENITIDIVPISHELDPPRPPRPSGAYKAFEDKTTSGQAKDIAAVHDNHEPGAILRSAPRAASELGHKKFATAIRKMAKDPEVLPELAIEGMSAKKPIPYSLPEQAAQIFRLRHTKKSYQDQRNDAVAKNFGEVYQTWDNVRDYCKKKCRPVIHSDDFRTWTEVQSALNHQLSRQLEIDPFLEAQLIVRHLTGHENSLAFQWGCDGCSDNSEYRNKQDKSQKTMIASVLQTVSIRAELQVGDTVLKEDLWTNQMVNSWMSVVPISYVFLEESIANVRDIGLQLFGEVEDLEDYLIPFGKTAVPVKFIGHPSLSDGKVCTIWSDFEKFVGYAQCFVCGATATEMSEPRGNLHWFIPKPGTLDLGLHPLHIEMTAFNWFCKTRFHRDFRHWRCEGDDCKVAYAWQKWCLQQEFKEKFHGLKVYQPRAGGGTTNTGRLCREAFSNPEVFSEICGVPVDLIRDFHNLILALTCKLAVDPKKFGDLCRSWLSRFYVSDIYWNWLSSSMHLILEHGEDILKAMPVDTPGLLSEQGSECNNRWWRHFREFHARKTSVSTSLRDPFVRKMEMADPEILAINAEKIRGGKRRRIRKQVPKIPLPEGVIALLTPEAREKYLASVSPTETEEPSDDEDILDYFDNLVIVNYSDGEGDDPPPPSSGKKRQAKDMEIDEEMDTSLNVKDLKAKSKSSRRKVAKISDVKPNVEMEEN